MTSTAILNFDDSGFVAVTKGSEYNESLTWSDKDGNPIDLSTYTAKMQVRMTHDSPLILQLSTEDSTITLNNLGVINFIIPSIITKCLPSGTFSYDFVLIDSTGIRTTLLRGEFVVNGDITL